MSSAEHAPFLNDDAEQTTTSKAVTFGELLAQAPPHVQEALYHEHPEPKRRRGFDVNAPPMAHRALEATVDVHYLRSA